MFALQAESTYLLTLDGDIDFKAESVTLLVDRMKKNKKVGAACGRIHPIGTGNLFQRSVNKMAYLLIWAGLYAIAWHALTSHCHVIS